MQVLNWIRKYWIELLVFGAIGAVLLIDLTPDITWINTNCDGPHYIYSAKYLMPAHKSSAPLYLLLGNLFLRIPFGTEAWRIALISGISGLITSIFVYLTLRLYTYKNKWSKIISCTGALIYGGSALALSQNIIIESYPLLTMFVIGAFYFALRQKWIVAAIFIGASGAVHPLALLSIIPMIIMFKQLRSWKCLCIAGSFILFYLYIPLTNRPPYMWHESNSNNGIFGFVKDTIDTAQMLSAGLSIWDFPKRILDAIGVFGVSVAIIGLVPLFFAFWKTNIWRNVLFWLVFLPIGYYVVNLAPQTYVYIQTGLVFACVAIGIGLTRIRKEWIIATLAIASGFLIYNGNYFDIGRTIDKELSARKFWNELDKVEDGQILLGQQGWEWAIVFPYNADNGRNIIPVSSGTLASREYQEQLTETYGIKLSAPTAEEVKEKKISLVQLQGIIVKEIAIQNKDKGIWTTVGTDLKTYGSKIIPVTDDNIDILDMNIPKGITDGSYDFSWRWKPSNPYDIITGAIEVDQWVFIIFSNYNILTFFMLSIIGSVPVYIGWMFIVRKKKWSVKKVVSEIRDTV